MKRSKDHSSLSNLQNDRKKVDISKFSKHLTSKNDHAFNPDRNSNYSKWFR
jgi:hypothetical protein